MFQSGDSVLVGVSGGPDSVALLHVLKRLTPRYSLNLIVAHLNHGLRRKASDTDADFVADLADQLNLRCIIRKLDVREYRQRCKLSLEEASRVLRHRFIQQAAEEHAINRIALGHHQDDNAELMLMYFFRGSGPLGLAGIPPIRGNIVRPLIHTSRSDILSFLKAERIRYVSDASNQDMRFLRNRIRLELLPDLKKNYNPLVTQAITRSAQVLRDENDWIEAMLEPIYQQSLSKSADGRTMLRVNDIRRFHVAVLRRLVRKALCEIKGDLRRISFRHITAIVRLILTGPARGRLDIPGGIRVYRSENIIYFLRDDGRRKRAERGTNFTAHDSPANFEYLISGPGTFFVKELDQRIRFSEGTLKKSLDLTRSGQHTVYFDMDKLRFPLVLRNFRPGDRFNPLGIKGTQKLKKFFINSKIPRSGRKACPLLLSEGNIVWVVGHRISDRVKIEPSTRRYFKGELLLA